MARSPRYKSSTQFRPSWMGRKNRWVVFISYFNGSSYAPYCHCDFGTAHMAERYAKEYTTEWVLNSNGKNEYWIKRDRL